MSRLIRFEDAKPTPREPKTKVATNKPETVATNKTANRRDPADFNAYQREYMRKRRAKATKNPALAG